MSWIYTFIALQCNICRTCKVRRNLVLHIQPAPTAVACRRICNYHYKLLSYVCRIYYRTRRYLHKIWWHTHSYLNLIIIITTVWSSFQHHISSYCSLTIWTKAQVDRVVTCQGCNRIRELFYRYRKAASRNITIHIRYRHRYHCIASLEEVIRSRIALYARYSTIVRRWYIIAIWRLTLSRT